MTPWQLFLSGFFLGGAFFTAFCGVLAKWSEKRVDVMIHWLVIGLVRFFRFFGLNVRTGDL